MRAVFVARFTNLKAYTEVFFFWLVNVVFVT